MKRNIYVKASSLGCHLPKKNIKSTNAASAIQDKIQPKKNPFIPIDGIKSKENTKRDNAPNNVEENNNPVIVN